MWQEYITQRLCLFVSDLSRLGRFGVRGSGFRAEARQNHKNSALQVPLVNQQYLGFRGGGLLRVFAVYVPYTLNLSGFIS